MYPFRIWVLENVSKTQIGKVGMRVHNPRANGRNIAGCRVQQWGTSGNRKFNWGIERGNKMRRQLCVVCF
jgi:hypothetical protein